jgi:hypothetical protein
MRNVHMPMQVTPGYICLMLSHEIILVTNLLEEYKLFGGP